MVIQKERQKNDTSWEASQAFQGIDTCQEVPSKEISLQEPIRNLCLSLGKRKQLGRLRKVKKVLILTAVYKQVQLVQKPKWIKKYIKLPSMRSRTKLGFPQILFSF